MCLVSYISLPAAGSCTVTYNEAFLVVVGGQERLHLETTVCMAVDTRAAYLCRCGHLM